MSSWDAPTGNWDSRHEPDESGRPDERGYQQGEPSGGYRTVRDGEGRLRAGRRGLPGYEQAQSRDQAAVDYSQGSGYGPGPGYGQQGYGAAAGPQPGYGSEFGSSGTGQMVQYGQRPADESAFGSVPLSSPPAQGPLEPPGGPDPLGLGPSGPQGTFDSGPRHASGSPQAPHGPGPQGAVGYGEEANGAYRQYGADEPIRSGWSDAGDRQGYGDRPGYDDHHGYGAPASYGSSPSSSQGYGQSSFTPSGPGPDQGYGQHSYGQQGYDQPGYGQQGSSQGSDFPPGGYGGQADRAGRDYQNEAYARPGAEPSDYPQSDFGENGYGQNGYVPDRQPGFGQDPDVSQAYGSQPGFGQDPDVSQAYGSQPGYGQNGQATYAPDGYGQDAYAQNGYAQDGGYAPSGAGPGTRQDGYPPDPYSQDPYGGQGGYAPDDYGRDGYDQQGYDQQGYDQQGYEHQGFDQQGYDQSGATPGYGDDDFGSRGRASRSRSGTRGPQQPGRTRMILYLAGAVVAVVVIVYLVIHLTNSGSGTPAAGSPTTSASASPSGAAAGPAGSYVFKVVPAVGPYPLNQPAVNALAAAAKDQSAPIASSVQSKGIGRSTKTVVGIYNLGKVTSTTSSAYKGIVFVGYDGTFNVTSTITVVRAHLVSSRVVNAGSHGGEMVCGYNTSTGTDTSECVWVTKSTLGVVQFISGQTPVKYPGAAGRALQVRQAVEVPAS